MVDVQNVSQSFISAGEVIPAVKTANFQIDENSFNIIYGASGSGKSTLLNMIAGIQKPTQGQVLVGGKDIYKLSADDLAFFRANRLGIVYQKTEWVRSLNVLENVSIPLYFLGYSRAVAAKIAMQSLERVNMESYANKYPMVLSGGEQQRIAMARALSTSPLFIIADEPTGNLDTQNGDRIIKILQNCKTEFRCTVILVTHNLEYLPLADKLIYMHDGFAEALPTKDMVQTADNLISGLKARISQLARIKQDA